MPPPSCLSLFALIPIFDGSGCGQMSLILLGVWSQLSAGYTAYGMRSSVLEQLVLSEGGCDRLYLERCNSEATIFKFFL